MEKEVHFLKVFIKKNFPFFVNTYRYIKYAGNSIYWIKRRRWPLRVVFEDAYREMGHLESASGGGSTLYVTETIRKEIPILIQKFRVQSLVDTPCGDFNWMREVPFVNCMYYGGDIVPALIRINQEKYGSENRRFFVVDITKDRVPSGDLILCRDCLVHLSYTNIKNSLKNFQESGAKYLLTTFFPESTKNKDVISGDWRPLNLCLEPFRFPNPILIINENFSGIDGMYKDKSLGLWDLRELTF